MPATKKILKILHTQDYMHKVYAEGGRMIKKNMDGLCAIPNKQVAKLEFID